MAANPRPDPNEKLVRVFDAEQDSEAMVVSGLLQSQGIDCETTAVDLAQDVFPMGGAMILVREEDADRARQIIEEYRRTPSERQTADDGEANDDQTNDDQTND